VNPGLFRARMRLVTCLRASLQRRGYQEVITGCLQESAGPDPEIEPFSVPYRPRMEPEPGARTLFLHPSPEFAMKRLLCRGLPAIYQLGPAFRQGELGPGHAPEFLMAEWYRAGWNYRDLMAEVEAVVTETVGGEVYVNGRKLRLEPPFPRLSVSEALAAAGVKQSELQGADERERRERFYHVFVDRLEPWLARQGALFLADFPPELALLARLGPGGLAERFELIVAGVELANGATELYAAADYRRRFERDRAIRAASGKPDLPLPAAFLRDLDEFGLPDCAGVAVGVDRLAQLAAGAARLEEVQAFPFSR